MDSSIATDPRFKVLALDLGRSRNEVTGALFFVWLACYERRSERLAKRLADASAEIDGFGDALVAAELADDDGESVIVHGVSERIAFLKKQADRGRKGGKKGKGKPKARPAKANAKQSRSEATAKPLTLTPDPALTQPPDPVRVQRARAHVYPSGPIAERLWQRQEELRQAIRDEGIDTETRALGLAVLSQLEPVRALLADGYTGEQLDHVLDVYAAEARAKRTLRHFNGTTNWQPKNVGIAMAMSPEQQGHVIADEDDLTPEDLMAIARGDAR